MVPALLAVPRSGVEVRPLCDDLWVETETPRASKDVLQELAQKLYWWRVPARTWWGAALRVAIFLLWIIGGIVRAAQGASLQALFALLFALFLAPEAVLTVRKWQQSGF